MEFSVLISVYKKENPDYFSEALNSVIKQTIQPSEIVIVQDGELSEELYKVCDEMKSLYGNFIRVISLKENVGLGKALQIGVEACRFELIARMDTDDIAKPDRFEKQLELFKDYPDLAMAGGYIAEFYKKYDVVHAVRRVPVGYKELYDFAKRRNPFNHMTVMFRKSAILDVGNYQPMYLCEDYYLWIRLLIAGYKAVNIPEVLVHVRTGEAMYARRGGWKYFKSEYALQKKFLQMGFINDREFMMNLIIRFTARILPNNIRSFIYEKFMRTV